MKIFIDDSEITSGIKSHTPPKRSLNMGHNLQIVMRDKDLSQRTTYRAKTEKPVEFRHRTKSPFSYYKQFTVENGIATAFNSVIVDPVAFTESDQYCYYDSLALRKSDYEALAKEIGFIKHNMVMDAWENFTSDSEWGDPDTNWTTAEPGTTNVMIWRGFGSINGLHFKNVVEIYDLDVVNSGEITHAIGSSKESGTVYAILAAGQTNGLCYIELDDIFLGFSNGGKFIYDTGAGGVETSITYNAYQFYIFKIEWDSAANTVNFYYWNNHEWATIAELTDQALFGAVSNITIKGSTDQFRLFCAAVDTSWATNYVENRILTITACDITFSDYFAASTTNTYRLFYDDATREVPTYYVGDYEVVETSGTDPLTITTYDGVVINDLTSTNTFQTSFKDRNAVEWALDSIALYITPAFANTTRGYTWTNNIFSETILYSAANEYIIIRTYNNGLQKITVRNDAANYYSFYHKANDSIFVDEVYFHQGAAWQTGTFAANHADYDVLDEGKFIKSDQGSLSGAAKETAWIFFWDESQTGATNIYSRCDDDLQNRCWMHIGITAGGAQLSSSAETTVWDGIIDIESSTDTDQQDFVDDRYDLYIGSSLTIGSMGSRTANTGVTYRLWGGYLDNLKWKDKVNELTLDCLDPLSKLGRNKIRYHTNMIDKTSQVSSVAAQQLGIQCDYDLDKVLEDVTYWGTGTEIPDDFCNGYIILITHKDPTLADTFAFANSVTAGARATFATGHGDVALTKQWADYVATTTYLKNANNQAFTFTSKEPHATVTEITLKYKVACKADRETPTSFKIALWNYTTSDYDYIVTLPAENGIYEGDYTVTSSADDYVKAADDEMKVLIEANYPAAYDRNRLYTFFLRLSCLGTGAAYTANQYTCSDSTKNTLDIAAGSFVTDGVSVGDAVAVVPTVSVVLEEILRYAPELDEEDIPTLTDGMDIEVVGATALDVVRRIATHLDYDFWVASDNDFQFQNSFASSGYTFYTHGVNRNILYAEIYDTRENMANRILYIGKKIIIKTAGLEKVYQNVESDWEVDNTAVASEGLHQDIVSEEDFRTQKECSDKAVAELAKRKDIETAALIRILGDDYIEEDLLGKTVVLDANGTQYTLLVEGITYLQSLGSAAPLILELRLGNQPINLDGNTLLIKKLADLDRKNRILASGRMVND